MRKKYKNELFNSILNSGLSPIDFHLTEDLENNSPRTVVGYKKTPFNFFIINCGETFDEFESKYIRYAHDFPISEVYPDQFYALFSSILDQFKYWLKHHIKEYEQDLFEPDLWSEFKNGNNSIVNLENIDFSDKSSFSSSERRQISMAINELSLLVHKNFSTTSEEQVLVNDRLNYLVEACDRLNKFDWKSLVISTIIGISTTLALDGDKGKLLFELFRQVFTSIKNIAQ